MGKPVEPPNLIPLSPYATGSVLGDVPFSPTAVPQHPRLTAPIWVTLQAGRAGPNVAIHVLMNIIHLRLAVFVTMRATE